MPSLTLANSNQEPDSSNLALAYGLVLNNLNILNHNCLLSFPLGLDLATLVPSQVG